MENVEKHPKTYCMIKTDIVLALAKTHLSAYETMILFAIIRKTYGWENEDGTRKTEDWISYSQIKQLTGITQDSHISRTIKLLLSKNIVTKGGKKIGINKNVDSWLKLPKGVNTHHSEKLPKGVSEVTKGGNSKLPKGADTIETNTKETNTKERICVYSTQLNFEKEYIEQLQQQFPRVTVEEELEKARDWIAANGKKYKDYKAFIRNWLRNARPTKREVIVL